MSFAPILISFVALCLVAQVVWFATQFEVLRLSVFRFIDWIERATQARGRMPITRTRAGMVKVKPLDQKRLLGVAGHHAIVTDRKIEEGGGDVGCTSGELLLLAIGSCATGSLRKFLWATRLPTDGLEVDVNFEPSAVVGERDVIAIDICLPAAVLDGRRDEVTVASQSGRVVSRIRLGSKVVVRCRSPETSPASAPREEILS